MSDVIVNFVCMALRLSALYARGLCCCVPGILTPGPLDLVLNKALLLRSVGPFEYLNV